MLSAGPSTTGARFRSQWGTIPETAYNGVVGSHLQAGLLNLNQVPFSAFRPYGRTLLNSSITSPAAQAAGLTDPYSGFSTSHYFSTHTVAQSLRPYPQYSNIDTASGGGDHSGHSSYHAALIRLEKRYGNGLVLQTSYVFSKILTDTDNYWPGSAALDQYNQRLEKSIGQFDTTHNFKLGMVYELPFGKGKSFLSKGVTSAVLGNWRVSTLHYYASGLPVSLGTSVNFPIFSGRNAPTVTTYDGWRGAQAGGSFDPQTDRFFQPSSFFGPQPTDRPGNETRYNPKLRQFAELQRERLGGRDLSHKGKASPGLPRRGLQHFEPRPLRHRSHPTAGSKSRQTHRRWRPAQYAQANAIRAKALLVNYSRHCGGRDHPRTIALVRKLNFRPHISGSRQRSRSKARCCEVGTSVGSRTGTVAA